MDLSFECDNRVAVLSFTRPASLNAITSRMRLEMRRIFREVEAGGRVRCLILRGEGGRAFSVGADLKESTTPTAEQDLDVHVGGLLTDFPSVPTIAAIDGYAIGGGFELALGCDIRIASTRSSFSLPEVKIGSLPGSGGTQRLVRTIGQSAAMQMLLTGEAIGAARALELGIVSSLHEPDDLDAEAVRIAGQIARNSPTAVRAVKLLAQTSPDVPLAAGSAMERLAFGLMRTTRDRAEGRAAFRESRAPQFEDRGN